MRKASMNFKSGALYTKDGRKLADIDSGVVEWGVQVTAEAPTKSVATVARNATGTIEGKQQIGRLDVLSLMYGIFSIMQMNAEEAAKAVKDVTNENVLIVLHAADSRNTVKKAAKSQAEALEPAER